MANAPRSQTTLHFVSPLPDTLGVDGEADRVVSNNVEQKGYNNQ